MGIALGRRETLGNNFAPSALPTNAKPGLRVIACPRQAHTMAQPSTDQSMKIRFVVALVGLAISFAPPAFAQQKDTVDPETAQQVRALASKYDATFNRQDAVTVAGLYAEDAVFNTPEGTFQGRQAIEELYAKHYFGEVHSKNVVTVVNEAIAAGNEVKSHCFSAKPGELPAKGYRV
jgi:hypothetical protein